MYNMTRLHVAVCNLDLQTHSVVVDPNTKQMLGDVYHPTPLNDTFSDISQLRANNTVAQTVRLDFVK